MSESAIKLYIPGPVEVSEKTFRAMGKPMIGHRSKDFQNLYASIQPRLQELFQTTGPVYLSTSSAWGVMEGALRNLAPSRTLHCMCGAFSDKWLDVSRRCGREAEAVQVEWGEPIRPAQLEEALQKGPFDAVTLVHNETSTGVLNPLEELSEVMRQHPETLFIVDTVSSFSAMPIATEKLGIDLLLTGSQKALALPPGLSLFTISEKALQRAASVEGRGYYFDILEFQKNHEKNMTPSTPSIPHIYALESKLEDIFDEGLSARFARHEKLNAMVHDWARGKGFEFLAPEGFRSKSLTCLKNNLALDLPAWIDRLRSRHKCVFDGGYGKLKGETLRISNMGDETEASIARLLEYLDDTIQG